MKGPQENLSSYYRWQSAMVIAKNKVRETWYGPGIYITSTVGLLLAYVITSSYVKSIGSGGFNSSLNSIFDFLSGLLIGAFGEAFFLLTFAEGPFLFSLVIAFLPILIHLTISSVFRFGTEKNVGALKLISFGPSDGTSYIVGSILKDLFFYTIFMLLLWCFFVLGGLKNNLLLGPKFYFGLLAVVPVALCFSSYGIIASAVTNNSGSAIALFAGVILALILAQLNSLLNVQGYIRDLSTTLSWVIKWISPFSFWQWAMDGVDSAAWGKYILSLAGSLFLSSILIGISHFVLRYREGD